MRPEEGRGGGTSGQIDVVDHERLWDHETAGSAALAVLSTVAQLEHRDPTNLPPLFESIEPDALNALFPEASENTVQRVDFRYCGYDVTVRPSVIRVRNDG